MMLKRVVSLVLLVGTVSSAAWSLGFSENQNAAVTQALAKIVEDRDQTAEYVLEVKSKFKPDDADYQQARDLYITALAKHNAWIAVVKSAIQSGKTKNLGQDQTYQTVAAEADHPRF